MDPFLDKLDVERLVTDTVTFLPSLMAALLVLIAFWMLYRLSRRPLFAALRRAGLHEKLVSLLIASIYRYSLLAIGLVMAASQLGINVAAALTGLGVAGIAVGFAAQDSLANLIAGILIFWDKPFVVGDWVRVEGAYGMVQNITLRSTRIRTPRNTYVVIPNKSIIDAVLENNSKHGELRIDVPVGIAYKEDIRQARTVILAAVGTLPHLRSDPAPSVVVDALGNSSVDLQVRVWIDDAVLERGTRFAVVEACKLALDEAGIQIPFPHLQLFWDDVEERVVDKLDRLVTSGGRPDE
ncbi:MAG: mechanosensitive ion channel family protein [Candidatus Krumholzibacteriia bacterium]